jgi:NodT family efflux transporter outer membrane factor (OMF) lipoprotein
MKGVVAVMSRLLAVLLVLVVTTGCALGPRYQRPDVAVPDTHRGAPAAATAESLGDREWSALFDDPVLTELVTTALRQNFDLRIAAERVQQARAQSRIARSERFPTIGASAGVVTSGASREGATPIPDGVDRDVTYGEAGVRLGWELDVWGRVRSLDEAARARYFASEEARRGVVTILVGDVMETYLALRALDLELDIARRTTEVATEGLRLTRARQERGIGNNLDVRQAEQLLYIARGQVAAAERAIAEREHALSLLLGQAPGDIARGRALVALTAPPQIPAGLPSSLLERRPDIRQAEQELIAANAEIGAAKAEYFPRISLTGLLGLQSRSLTAFVSGGAGLWSAGLGAAAPIFNAGRTGANVRLAESVQRELVVRYQRAIHAALRDVADALTGHRKTADQRGEQQQLVEALEASARLSRQRYEGGVDNYLQVLDAQRNLFQGELELARLRQRELASIVQLYRALGGGWTPSQAPGGNAAPTS